MQRKAEMWQGDRRGKERHKEIIDDDGYETFSYEYKSHSLKKPSDSGDMPRRHSGCRHERVSPHYKQYSPERTERVYSDQRGEERRRSRRKASLQARNSRDPYLRDRVTLNQAATKIQAAFRGYLSRKEFWKKKEQYWRKQRLANSHRYIQDEIILPSESISTINDVYLSGLATNADPNLGLTAPLPTLDSSEKNYVLRELKSKQKFSDDVTSVNQLQTETSPTVVLFGGINPAQAKDYFLGSAMLVYNVRKDKYYFAGTMPEPRNYHGAVYLNGKVYITGGYSPLHVIHGQMVSTQTTFQLTVRSKRWRRRADMHQARACHGTCVVDENVMVFGGRDASGKLLSTVEVYYPKRDQWILAKPMPEAIMGMSVAVLDGCVWIVGGIINEGHSSRYTVSNHVYTFDTQQQRYYRKILLPEPRAFSCAASLKHELWVWCGLKDALSEEGLPVSTNTVYVYNPEITNWEQHAAIGTPKHAAAAAKFGRRVYLFGGMSSVSGSKEVLNENDHYNRENDKYFEGASLPSPLTGSAAIALPIDYIATSDPKWNFENLDESAYNEAATKIQAAYRGYRTRSLVSNHKLLMYSSDADLITKNNRMNSYQNSANGSYSDKWKLFQRVQIDDWPPVPDPRSSSSELNVQLGTLPPGYTVTASNSKTKVKRYVPLPEHCDPNLAMCGHLCNVYKKTRNVLGLRKVEHMPSFAKNMLTVTTLQDDSLPVVLVMGGLQPRDPVNLSYAFLICRKAYYEISSIEKSLGIFWCTARTKKLSCCCLLSGVYLCNWWL
ncbi:beta-scruin-like [Stegodyphus dumicola]|nr:beta-scruin-like [Stegodyphus dumicola]